MDANAHVGWTRTTAGEVAIITEEEGEAGIKFTSKPGKGTSFTFLIKDQNEKDHDSFHINFFEPQVFAENIENLSLKMSPYSGKR